MKIINILIFLLGSVINLMSQEINKTIFIQENSMVTYTRSYGTNILSIAEWQVYSNTKLGYVFAKHHAGFIFNSTDYRKLILDNGNSHLIQNQFGAGYRFIYPISKFAVYCDVFFSKFYFQNVFNPTDSTSIISGTNAKGYKYGGELGFSYFVSSKTAINFSFDYFSENLNIDNSGFGTIERKKGIQSSIGGLFYF